MLTSSRVGVQSNFQINESQYVCWWRAVLSNKQMYLARINNIMWRNVRYWVFHLARYSLLLYNVTVTHWMTSKHSNSASHYWFICQYNSVTETISEVILDQTYHLASDQWWADTLFYLAATYLTNTKEQLRLVQ